ncbi:unnamed protein product [Nyctereutes procyonoides]|uniref:(raccoon dog) hypothetical protein n=1 Tax=Nyctereutes procyonoides TaxID=34880 RepID=A0A811ZHV3_NYCPR|nr:unnamed protein product [Nyctereutes procyonoides]CAD7688241.1 unnamed protein product [Nyctereutes procyonoides]
MCEGNPLRHSILAQGWVTTTMIVSSPGPTAGSLMQELFSQAEDHELEGNLSSNPIHLCPYKKGKFGHRDTLAKREHHVKIKAEVRGMLVQAQEHLTCQPPNRSQHPTLDGGNPLLEKSQVNQTRKLAELRAASLCLKATEGVWGTVVPGSFQGSVWMRESAQLFQQIILFVFVFVFPLSFPAVYHTTVETI